MAKKMTKKEAEMWIWLVIIALPVWGIVALVETAGWVTPTVIAGLCVAVYFWHQHEKKKQRLAYLREKYSDEDLVQKIFGGYFWQGQSEEQLIDALGEPEAIDKKVLKTKKKEVWKYNHQGANRYNLRITLENNLVVGWDKKA